MTSCTQRLRNNVGGTPHTIDLALAFSLEAPGRMPGPPVARGFFPPPSSCPVPALTKWTALGVSPNAVHLRIFPTTTERSEMDEHSDLRIESNGQDAHRSN